VTRFRRLRVWAPDEALLKRLAAGESYHSLGRSYGVSHTTVSAYCRRPEVIARVGELRRRQQAERRALREQRVEERRAEKKLRARARAEAKLDRAHEAWRRSAKPWRRSEEEVWLDERDAPPGSPSWERWSNNDDEAEKTVAAGGGIEEVMQATGFRTRLAVYESIDPQIVVRAIRNDRRRQRSTQLPTNGLRRLKPDPVLISRRAAGEPLRQLAADYGVSHTTLSRYFRRDEAKKLLRPHHARRKPAPSVRSEAQPGGGSRNL
jgi:hypothetical protein